MGRRRRGACHFEQYKHNTHTHDPTTDNIWQTNNNQLKSIQKKYQQMTTPDRESHTDRYTPIANIRSRFQHKQNTTTNTTPATTKQTKAFIKHSIMSPT
jgi:hypothetical protein